MSDHMTHPVWMGGTSALHTPPPVASSSGLRGLRGLPKRAQEKNEVLAFNSLKAACGIIVCGPLAPTTCGSAFCRGSVSRGRWAGWGKLWEEKVSTVESPWWEGLGDVGLVAPLRPPCMQPPAFLRDGGQDRPFTSCRPRAEELSSSIRSWTETPPPAWAYCPRKHLGGQATVGIDDHVAQKTSGSLRGPSTWAP